MCCLWSLRPLYIQHTLRCLPASPVSPDLSFVCNRTLHSYTYTHISTCACPSNCSSRNHKQSAGMCTMGKFSLRFCSLSLSLYVCVCVCESWRCVSDYQRACVCCICVRVCVCVCVSVWVHESQMAEKRT